MQLIRGYTGLSGEPKCQHGDKHTNTLERKPKNREAQLQFLQHQYWHSQEENIQNDNCTHQTNMTDTITDDMIK